MSFKYFGNKEKVERARVVILFRLNELKHVPGSNLEKFVPLLTEKKSDICNPLLLYCGDCTCKRKIKLFSLQITILDRFIKFTLQSFFKRFSLLVHPYHA